MRKWVTEVFAPCRGATDHTARRIIVLPTTPSGSGGLSYFLLIWKSLYSHAGGLNVSEMPSLESYSFVSLMQRSGIDTEPLIRSIGRNMGAR